MSGCFTTCQPTWLGVLCKPLLGRRLVSLSYVEKEESKRFDGEDHKRRVDTEIQQTSKEKRREQEWQQDDIDRHLENRMEGEKKMPIYRTSPLQAC